MTEHNLKTVIVPVDKIETYPGNARRGRLHLIKESIEANGFYTPIVVQRSTGYILAGNHRYLAAKELAFAKLPVVYLDVDDDRARRIVLADNKTSDDATYDTDELATLLRDVGDDLLGTGFDDDEVDKILNGLEEGGDPYDSETEADYTARWEIVVECKDEEQQQKLFEKFEAEGLSVRVLSL